MSALAKGQRLKLADLVPGGGQFRVGLAARGLSLDFACFGLDADGKLSDERYMVFFNQPVSPCGGVELCATPGDAVGFTLQLERLPASLDRLVFTASLDGDGSLAGLETGYLRIIDGEAETGRYTFAGKDFNAERAVMLGEFYRKEGNWRFAANGQGFNGGLDALVRHFGGAVAEPSPLPSAPPARISLDKRVEKEAPHLVNLVKQAAVCLEKVGLSAHRAKVCLCLDISGSMGELYRKGLVQSFAERILALGCRFDDDGEIDVFLFGEKVHQPPPLGLGNCRGYIDDVLHQYPLEGDTRYGRAMEAIRKFYFPDTAGGERKYPFKSDLPVYVMFVTDGSTNDKSVTEKQLRWSSHEPIFWQFMGIGKGRKSKSKKLFSFADSDFPFLESLDELSGRLVDNANFFAVSSPDEHPDSGLYDLLMTEYPGWIGLARKNGLLP